MSQGPSDNDWRATFEQAFAAHRSGDLDVAEGLYRRIHESSPDNAHVVHLLGVIALQKGRLEDAREHIAAAIALDDGPAPFHCNLGEAHRLLGALEDAERCFLDALEREPRYPQALANLGTTLYQLRRPTEAVTRFQQVLELAGPSAEAWYNLGLAQRAAGATDDAIASFREALAADPDHVEASTNLGTMLVETGDLEAAEALLQNAVRLDAGAADAWSGLARIRAGRSELDVAEEYARRAIAIDPEIAEYQYVLGLVLKDTEHLGEAESALRRSLDLDPEAPMTHHTLALLMLIQGRFEEAEASFESALALDPELLDAYAALADIRADRITDPAEIERLEELAGRLQGDSPERISFEFALAKMLENCNEFDRSFAHLQIGNELKRKKLDYDPAVLWRLLDDTKAIITRDLIERIARLGSESDVPILIVGLPRSGTTLVEQILASHPQVAGAGETGFMSAAARSLGEASGVRYPLCLPDLTKTVMQGLERDYLERLERDRGDARHVTDKRPNNFEHLGLVAMLFPRARIIHCTRDPLDTCFSMYCQDFLKQNAFAYDLRDLAEAYRYYRSMMEYWHATLPIPILDVSYEELVENQEPMTRKLLAHCDLPWDERCLHPHETDRDVRTASYWQVRQPIYRSSVARWKCFEKHLGPLIEGLGEYARNGREAWGSKR